jgi:hypothetical protein
VLIRAFDVEVAGPRQTVALVQYREVARSGIEPHIQNVGSLAERAAAALPAAGVGLQQFRLRPVVPDIGGVLAEQIDDAIQVFAIGQRLPAALAIEHDDGHAPHPLTRDAPIGAAAHHAGHALLAPTGDPLHCLDGLERLAAQVVPRHADEPLLGGAEDGRLVAAPAVRVAVVQPGLGQQGAALPQNPHHHGIRFPHRLADDLLWQNARRPFRVEEAAGRVDGAVCGDSVEPGNGIVFLTVSRGSVDHARTLLQGHKLGEDALRITFQERMSEDETFHRLAEKPRLWVAVGPSALISS